MFSYYSNKVKIFIIWLFKAQVCQPLLQISLNIFISEVTEDEPVVIAVIARLWLAESLLGNVDAGNKMSEMWVSPFD